MSDGSELDRRRRWTHRRDHSRSPSNSERSWRRDRSRSSGSRSPSFSGCGTRSRSPSTWSSDYWSLSSRSSRSRSRSRSPSSSSMSSGRRRSPSRSPPPRSGRRRSPSRPPTPHQNGHRAEEDDRDRRVRDRSPDSRRRRSGRSRSPSHRRIGRSRSPGRGGAPRSCRSRSRTRSYECEDRRCCRQRQQRDDDDEREEDVFVRIDGYDRLFNCVQCHNLLSSPVYECAEGHLTCAACHSSANEERGNEDVEPAYRRCGERNFRRSRAAEEWLSSIRFPCRNYNHGCPAYRPRHAIDAHERACRHAPCFCPVRRCEFPGDAAGELERHLTADHGWHRVVFRYGQPFNLRVRRRSVLLAEDDGKIFHLRANSKRGTTALSMVWIRPDSAAAGEAEFTYDVRMPAVEGVPQRLQMQATVWGTSLEYGRADADQVCVTVPDFMFPTDGPNADSVEVRVDRIEPAAPRNET